MLNESPSFEDEKTDKIVNNEIEKYSKNTKDTKDMIHCPLFFFKRRR